MSPQDRYRPQTNRRRERGYRPYNNYNSINNDHAATYFGESNAQTYNYGGHPRMHSSSVHTGYGQGNYGYTERHEGHHAPTFAQYYGGLYGQASHSSQRSQQQDTYTQNHAYHNYSTCSQNNQYNVNHNHRSSPERSSSPQRGLHTRRTTPSAPYIAPPTFQLTPQSAPSSDINTPPPTVPTAPQKDCAEPLPSSPSPSYLALCVEPSTSLSTPSDARKLLILDLNGTLLIRSQHGRRRAPLTQVHAEDGAHEIPTGPAPRMRAVQPRPYIPSFRAYLFAPQTKEWLDVMVWSSAQPHSVGDMVNKCFGGTKEELVAVWDRSSLGLGKEDYFRKTQTTKDLTKPWSLLSLPPSSHPPTSSGSSPQSPPSVSSTVHSALTTLLLDDSPLKARLQPYNHVCIPEYDSKRRGGDLAAIEAERAGESSKSLTVEHVHMGEDVSGATEEGENVEDGGKKSKKNKKKKAKKEKREREPGVECPDSPATPTSNSVEVSRLRDITSPSPRSSEPYRLESVRAQEEPYDPTLLAVIGVLDALKTESSVAGWIRAGGLWGHAHKMQAEGGNVDSDMNVTGEEAAQPMWFEDASAISYWLSRGRRALDELGIEVKHGVEA